MQVLSDYIMGLSCKSIAVVTLVGVFMRTTMHLIIDLY